MEHDQSKGGEKPHQQEEDERPRSAPPRIYVASLADYVGGHLHGVWLEVTGDADELEERVKRMLSASPLPGAEEWAIHDYEGFGPIYLHEHEPLERVAKLARGIAEHGPAFAHWVALVASLGAAADPTEGFRSVTSGTGPRSRTTRQSLSPISVTRSSWSRLSAKAFDPMFASTSGPLCAILSSLARLSPVPATTASTSSRHRRGDQSGSLSARLDGRPVRTSKRDVRFVRTANPSIYPRRCEPMTKAQEVFERVEALVAEGARKADVFRQLAEEYGQPQSSIRGAYYAYTRPTNGPSKRSRTVRDPIESAVIVLENAITAIDGEIEIAKNRADDAVARYKELRDTAEERKSAVQAKIDALRA
jgi:antirestriction protein ArdA